MSYDEGTRMMICAPVVRGKKGYHRDVIEALQKQGFVRARVNGNVIDVREALKEGGDNPLGLGRYEMHTIEAVVDRVVIKAEARQRVADSVEAALKLADGALVVLTQQADDGESPMLLRELLNVGPSIASARSSPARITRSVRLMSLSRVCSRSTRRTVRARSATGLAR
jgi:excinuclease UvrABC ATPase subunit